MVGMLSMLNKVVGLLLVVNHAVGAVLLTAAVVARPVVLARIDIPAPNKLLTTSNLLGIRQVDCLHDLQVGLWLLLLHIRFRTPSSST